MFPPEDDLYEAARSLVMRLGVAKRVGLKLRPELSMEQARTWLDNCLNRDRQEKLDMDQIDFLIGLGRKAGIHTIPETIARRHLYRIEPIDPESERARIQREFTNAAERLQELLERMEKLNGLGRKLDEAANTSFPTHGDNLAFARKQAD